MLEWGGRLKPRLGYIGTLTSLWKLIELLHVPSFVFCSAFRLSARHHPVHTDIAERIICAGKAARESS